MNALPAKEQYAKAVCFFLAELLRTRKVELKRCAEIAQKVVENINLLETEQDFLRLVKEMTADFEELTHLERRVSFSIQVSDREKLEADVREFAIHTISHDPALVTTLLAEAMKEGANLSNLYSQYPQFQEFNLARHPHARTH